MCRHSILLAWLVILTLSATAEADYRSEYAAYNTAFSAGDVPAALTHGEAAWRASETENGAHRTTAVLAYNFARLAEYGDPKKMLEAYQRVAALIAAGVSDLDAADIELRTAFAAYRVDSSPENAVTLRSVLKRQTADGRSPSEASVMALRELAQVGIRKTRYATAREDADAAVLALRELKDPAADLGSSVMTLAAIAHLAPGRTSTDIADSVLLLNALITGYPPQAGIDAFDKGLALAISLRSTASELILSGDGKFRQTRVTDSRLATKDDLVRAFESTAKQDTRFDARFKSSSPPPDGVNCATEWEARTLPYFPARPRDQFEVGAVLLGYELNETGVERVVVLSDGMGGKEFGEVAANAVKSWRLSKPVPKECWKNQTAVFKFGFR